MWGTEGLLSGLCYQGFVRATPMIPGKIGGWEDNCGLSSSRVTYAQHDWNAIGNILGSHDTHNIQNELCSPTTGEPEDVPQSIKVHSSVIR